jgi:hypothetical protein
VPPPADHDDGKPDSILKCDVAADGIVAIDGKDGVVVPAPSTVKAGVVACPATDGIIAINGKDGGVVPSMERMEEWYQHRRL